MQIHLQWQPIDANFNVTVHCRHTAQASSMSRCPIRTALVVVDMRVVAADELGAVLAAVAQDGEQVSHGAAGHKQRRLHARYLCTHPAAHFRYHPITAAQSPYPAS